MSPTSAFDGKKGDDDHEHEHGDDCKGGGGNGGNKNDHTPPLITCPPEAKVLCGDSTEPENTGFATATDDTDPNPTLTWHDAVETDLCGTDRHDRVITRTWRARDKSGNSATCDQKILVVKTVMEMDVLPGTCPNEFTLDCDPLPITILGSDATPASLIQPSSVRVYAFADCSLGGVKPKGLYTGDVAGPRTLGGACNCEVTTPDGRNDMTFFFSKTKLAQQFNLTGLPSGTAVQLVISGKLCTGCDFIATDCLIMP